ncbi:hypothetical protein QWY81_16215 [Polaribacter undariae]|uniref:Glycine zipper family protein n=2 Tax=Polaribacter sejongensis TaxID=985043 RepID=A0AAJ1VJV8_9FLAO|nr:hypothetical protein [Polaribacter undariae]MDN3621012.1 hypothetical protein [Polaribacter undariae]UWD31144.1 hypothetical protein NQP51_13490 [Polaribacter undariae]
MKKLIFTIVLSVFALSFTNAQKIETKKVFGGYIFSQNDSNLTLSQMQEVMKDNKQAFDLMKSAKSNQTWGMILGVAGGGLVGFPVGTAIGGGEPKWALVGVGAALIVASIPIVKAVNRKTKEAVDLYNADVPSVSSNLNPSFNFNVKGVSMGISMSF